MFRSTIEYTDRLASSGCCCVPGDDAFKTTYTNCVSLGGYFSPADDDDDCSGFVCPDNDTKGCCCSCSALTAEQRIEWLEDQNQPNFGPVDGISPCECTRLGGNWTPDDCSALGGSPFGEQTLCFALGGVAPGDPEDVRWPNACCVYQDDGSVTCENTCSPEECSLAGQLSIYYDDGTVCGYVGPDGQAPRYCESDSFARLGGTEEETERRSGSLRDQIAESQSACVFINNVTGKTECTRVNKSQCDSLGGFFSGSDQDMNPIQCGEFPSNIKTKKLNISKITEEQANSIPIGGDFYGLGIYCGIYEPGVSVIQGTDTNTGITSSLTSPATTNIPSESNKHKNAIIISYRDFGWGNFGESKNRTVTSSWSGKHNIYSSTGLKGELANAVKDFQINGIGGWTVPSIEECGFIQESLMSDPETYLTLTMEYMRGKLLTSTINDFNVPSFYTTLSSTIINIGGVYYSKGYAFVQSGEYDSDKKPNGYRALDVYPFDQPNIILGGLNQPMSVRLIKTIKVVN